jgi:hypothetical protein
MMKLFLFYWNMFMIGIALCLGMPAVAKKPTGAVPSKSMASPAAEPEKERPIDFDGLQANELSETIIIYATGAASLAHDAVASHAQRHSAGIRGSRPSSSSNQTDGARNCAPNCYRIERSDSQKHTIVCLAGSKKGETEAVWIRSSGRFSYHPLSGGSGSFDETARLVCNLSL